jgi:hypothetical protein
LIRIANWCQKVIGELLEVKMVVGGVPDKFVGVDIIKTAKCIVTTLVDTLLQHARVRAFRDEFQSALAAVPVRRADRKMQKSVYRIRSHVCLEGRIALDMLRESHAEGRAQTTHRLHQARRGYT